MKRNLVTEQNALRKFAKDNRLSKYELLLAMALLFIANDNAELTDSGYEWADGFFRVDPQELYEESRLDKKQISRARKHLCTPAQ